jgi:hypothetical protein
MPDWLKALLDLTIRLVACVGVSWYAWRAGGGWPYGAITLVFSSLVWAVLFAGPIVRGIGRYIWWARKEPYIPWEGRYYEFQNVHVRIYEEDGKLWFVANDVLRVLGRKPDSTLAITYGEIDYKPVAGVLPPVHAFSERAAREFITRTRHPEAGKFLFWFEREVIAPHYKAKEIRASSGKTD